MFSEEDTPLMVVNFIGLKQVLRMLFPDACCLVSAIYLSAGINF